MQGGRAPVRLGAAAAVLAAGLLLLALRLDDEPGSPSARGAAERQLGPAAGAVRFLKHSEPSFDRYTHSARYAAWIGRHFWRMTTFSPYFDTRLRWFGRTWFYKDLYAIYRGGALARARPDWILRDARGRRLYIPFDCGGGSCPQYAGDIGNPGFRAHWIRTARATLERGYRGIWIDDVNMLRRVGDGRGREVAPVDPRSGSPITAAGWRQRVARFTEQIRAAFPRAELAHNALWIAGDEDAATRRQLAAADFVNLEHGVNDPGVRGGAGRYGLETLLAYIDRRQRDGGHVVLGGMGRSGAAREYALATYFLINAGGDAITSRFGSRPGAWWRGYDVSLGRPRGPRRLWEGMLRRDFERGLVLVNQPDAPRRRARLERRYVDVAGRPRRAVSLAAARGVVLRHAAGGDA